ncbi:MAG: DUF1343 domain-containing protein [Muribaculum sp.]|nr:DUF1343 domain-containing protein [Muribaculum sp.]
MMDKRNNVNMTIVRILLLSLLMAPLGLYALTVGAARTEMYRPLLEGKRTALLSNHTGMVGDKHTLDIMLENGIKVTHILSPEHGFRGAADAGQHVRGSIDPVSGLPIVSLYGGEGLSDELLSKIDAVAVDMQDVGTRFYTYHITMLKVMEAAASRGIPVIVFDRPNPLGMAVDGPMLDMSLKSGVGRIPVPVLHGLTMGEIALMANGEGWLRDGLKVVLTVIPVEGYTHSTLYKLPVAPSPNLKTMSAVYLYPSLCYFEGTVASVGRGTDYPFQTYGHPALKARGFTFTPRSMPGAKNPPLLGKLCQGVDLRSVPDSVAVAKGVDLSYIIDAYNSMTVRKDRFFTSFFDKLIGNRDVRKMIERGMTAEEIRLTWQNDLDAYRTLRLKYLIYPE